MAATVTLALPDVTPADVFLEAADSTETARQAARGAAEFFAALAKTFRQIESALDKDAKVGGGRAGVRVTGTKGMTDRLTDLKLVAAGDDD